MENKSLMAGSSMDMPYFIHRTSSNLAKTLLLSSVKLLDSFIYSPSCIGYLRFLKVLLSIFVKASPYRSSMDIIWSLRPCAPNLELGLCACFTHEILGYLI